MCSLNIYALVKLRTVTVNNNTLSSQYITIRSIIWVIISAECFHSSTCTCGAASATEFLFVHLCFQNLRGWYLCRKDSFQILIMLCWSVTIPHFRSLIIFLSVLDVSSYYLKIQCIFVFTIICFIFLLFFRLGR